MTEQKGCPDSEYLYTLDEEIFNSVSHGLGFFASIVGLVFLAIFAVSYGDVWHIVSFSIFGVTLILLYLGSSRVC